jgi:acyl dehydratase
MFKIFYDDIKVGDTEEFGSKTVSKEEIIDYASQYDPQPFHLDEDLAKHSVFGSLCASGWHTAAMTMRMMVDNMMGSGFAGMGSPGLDKLEWKKPVFPGDTLKVKTVILEKRESKSRPNIGLMKSQSEVLNQKDEVVMRMVSNIMVLKRKVG